MPSRQRGQVFRRGDGWAVRFYDAEGTRRRRGGFPTRAEALAWLEHKLNEVSAVRRGDRPRVTATKSVAELADVFLALHEVDPATTRKLRAQLCHAVNAFGSKRPDELDRLAVEAWRAQLSPGSRHDVFRAFRQLLAWAVERNLATRNAAAGIRNPKRKRHERRPVHPFETWDEIEAIAAELDPRYAAIPVLAVGTGLRPEEWIALERADVDREARVLHVRRRFSGGQLKRGGKTAGSERTVPLRQRVLDALETMPARIDTRFLFPAPRGGYIDLERFRHREWTPALRAAGLEHRRVYDMRHTVRNVGDRGRTALPRPPGAAHGNVGTRARGHVLPLARADGRAGADVSRRVRRARGSGPFGPLAVPGTA